ncbi:Nitrogen metabolite repression protein [Venturia nashicola]|nr:Nitrogen metabolite repression protein [Venturia nashicola]
MPYGYNDSVPLRRPISRPAPTFQVSSSQLDLKPLPDTPKNPSCPRQPSQSLLDFEQPPAERPIRREEHSGHNAAKLGSLFNFTIRRHVPILMFAVFCSILASSIPALQAYLLGKIFATFARFGAGAWTEVEFRQDLARYDTYLICLGASRWFSSGGMFAGWTWFGTLQARSARERLFVGLAKHPLSWFDQRQDGMGALTTEMHRHTKDLETATTLPLGTTMRDLLTSLSCFGVSFYSSWRLTLTMLATTPVIAILMLLLSSRIQPNIELQTTHLTMAAKHTTNAFSIIDTVKCYNGHVQEQRRYTHAIKQAASCYYRQVTWHAGQTAVFRFITLGMFVEGFWYGSTLIGKNAESAGTVFTAFWSCILAISSLMAILPQMMEFEKGKVAGAQLRSLIDVPFEPPPSNPGRLQAYAHDIKFKNVWFCYPTQPDRVVLQGVDLSFSAGDLTFVVGRSGSGKSTIGQLITKLYQPSQGKISFGDFGIQTLDYEWIRNAVLLVEQESVLFNTTIRENIALGRQNPASVAFKAIQEAAESFSILDTILDMPDGFDTMVGSKGVALSGGQIQRVALARARLRDPSVLILDECTSSLDQINRLAVMDAIRQWRKGKTTIVITHDISQIHPNDFVYVMDEGRVAEAGTHKALSKKKGSLFRELVKSSNPLRPSNRFTGTTLAALSEMDDRETRCQNMEEDLQLRRLTSGVALDSGLSTMRQSRGWATGALGTPLMTMNSWPPRASIVIPQSPIVRQSVYQKTPRTPKSPGADWGRLSRIGSPRTPHFRRSEWSQIIDQPYLPPTDDVPQIPMEVPKILEKGDDKETKERHPPEYTTNVILATIWPNLTSLDRFLLLFGFVAAIIFAASIPAFAFFFSKLLQTFYDPAERNAMALKYSLAVLSIAAGDAVTLFVAFSLIQCVAQSWVNTLRGKALARILDQPRDFFDQDENGVSQLTSCLDHHAEETQHILGRFVGNLVIVITTITVAVAWSMASCWKLTLVMLACTPVVLIITKALSNVAGTIEARTADEEEHATSIFAEAFTNIKTVQTLTLENWFRTRYQIAVEVVLKTGFKAGIYVGMFFGLSQGALLFMAAIVFHYGGVLVSSRQFNFQKITQVITLLLFSISTATLTMAGIPKLRACRESSSRLLRLVDLPSDSHETTGNEKITSADDIEFHNVQFRYSSRPDTLVLDGLNLRIKSGESVALVGTSGSGKTTIATLLLKLYSTQQNTIRISGHNINTLHTPTLRNLITIVSQTPTLFPTSISANIIYGLPRSHPLNSAANVRAAATAAGIHDFISSLPNGYDTIIGEGGMGLSGGQAQRVAIARALARQPHILILDEANSALDQTSAGGYDEDV